MSLRLPAASRRRFLSQMSFGAALFTTPGLFAEMLAMTPRQTEGPFYPDRFPLDTDNDLLILNDSITPAIGEVTHLTGRILSPAGEPVRNAVVEIWQVDGHGVYLHSGSSDKEKADANFQGFGRFLTGSKGEYYFRTVKPVPYPGRTPHIHFAINRGDKRMLTTQCYIKGHPGNARDGVFRGVGDKQDLVEVDFAPIADSKMGELAANFDIVVGNTPEDREEPRGAPPRRRPPR
jgi:protocatechuate 3,4-dioxygenase beta subunit